MTLIDKNNLKVGDNWKCVICGEPFTIDQFFLCPKCLQEVPTNLTHTFLNTKPIIDRLLIRFQSQESENNGCTYRILCQLYDRLRTLTMQLTYNQWLNHKGLSSFEISALKEKIKEELNWDINYTSENIEGFVGNFLTYETTTYHGECTFAIDWFLQEINSIHSIVDDSRFSSAKITKAVLKKINSPLTEKENPLRALAEIRNTYHNNMISTKNKCFEIDDKYSFILKEGIPHHYVTLFHILFLLEQSLPILENITGKLDE